MGSSTLDAEGRPIAGNQGGNVVETFGKSGITLAAAAVDALLVEGGLDAPRGPRLRDY
jgi:hypothetical protein